MSPAMVAAEAVTGNLVRYQGLRRVEVACGHCGDDRFLVKADAGQGDVFGQKLVAEQER
jgi:hypothetical protein